MKTHGHPISLSLTAKRNGFGLQSQWVWQVKSMGLNAGEYHVFSAEWLCVCKYTFFVQTPAFIACEQGNSFHPWHGLSKQMQILVFNSHQPFFQKRAVAQQAVFYPNKLIIRKNCLILQRNYNFSMSILITGASGFVGSHLVDEALQRGM